ncbi:MAG: hypothetical protein A3H43_03315 [Gammaproteobacteria bacterium RIFCSPLOWO2_02_FULL_42_9]|nr:MAG: hypothetical protein A3H43_03315 [Gammaproteobacteria bacterium RIFCSPLOWO2_02_FULL_42_9]
MIKYDAIIAGAGFAGLSLATRLRGNVLLINKYDIGEHNISACGTLVKTMKKIGAEELILQEFDTIALHTQNKVIDIPTRDHFCTIDYKQFCEFLFKHTSVDFKKATATAVRGNTVITNQGEFEAPLIIDATGWRAALASSIKKNYVNDQMISFGIETEIPYEDNKLRLFADPTIVENGAGWLFPAGHVARFGIGCYGKTTDLIPRLKHFVENRYGLKVGEIHGGGFGYHVKDEPVLDNLFVVGCAAGQTLPFTGEGIRRCIEFGIYLGDLIQQVLDKKITKEQAMQTYSAYAVKHKKYYNMLLWAQRKMPFMPNWKINLVAKILSLNIVANYAWQQYEKV